MLSSAQGAGLGKLAVLSSLGQPLRAEIELTSVAKDEVSSLVAKLASPEVFRQANIDFNPALLSLRFSVEQRGERHLIKITSSQPINEPYIDLLLELGANNARLVREYTFLLDPAELRSSQSVQIAAPIVLPGQPITGQPTTQVQGSQQQGQGQVQQRNNSSSQPAAPAPINNRRTGRAPPPDQPEPEAPAATQQSEYRVKRGDTLARIAGQVKPATVSLDQILVALYRANPDAFIGKNMNRLRSGQILTIPDANTLSAATKAEAQSVVIAHAADFNNYRNRLAGQVAQAAPAKTVDAKQSDTGKITAKVEEIPTAANESKDKLKLSKAQSAATGKAPNAVASAEDSIARDKAIADANSRVKELEKNVNDLQKALEIRSKEMAKTQVAAASVTLGKPGNAVAPAPTAAEQAKTKAEQAKAEQAKVELAKVEQAKAEQAKAELAKAEQAKAEQAKVEQAKAEQAKAEQAKAEQAKAEQAKAVAPSVAVPATTPVPAAKPVVVASPAKAPVPVPPQPSLIDELKDNYALPGALLALLGGLAAFGFMRSRRNRQVAPGTTLMPAGTSVVANSLFGHTGGQSVDTNNSLFNSNFSPSASQLDTNEVDPVAEADVYIAYGRDEQAEEILKEALRAHPDRNAVRVKLLEIYAARKDVRSFDMQASDLYGLTKGEGEEWAHVAGLGVSIDPNNPLYAGGELPLEVAEKTTQLLSSSTMPLEELDPDALLVNTQTRQAVQAGSVKIDHQSGQRIDPVLDIDQIASQVATNGLDFDLGAPLAPVAESVIDVPSLPVEDKPARHDLDFDLSPAGDAVMPASASVGSAPSTDLQKQPEKMGEVPELDFNSKTALSGASPTVAASQFEKPAKKETFAELDFDLGDATIEEIDLKSVAPHPVKPAIETPGDLHFNFDDADVEVVEPGAAPAGDAPQEPATAGPANKAADPASVFNFDFNADQAPVPELAPFADYPASIRLPEVGENTAANDAVNDAINDVAAKAENKVKNKAEDTFLPSFQPDAFGKNEKSTVTAFPTPEPAHAALDLNLGGIDLNLDQDNGPESASGGESALNTWDHATSDNAEMATKLDLAEAYQDIGDKEGARELLEEVLHGGTPEQIEKAGVLRKKLG